MALLTPAVRVTMLKMARDITREPGVADTLVQDAIIRAADHFESAQPTNFGSWMLSIIKNLALHWLRRKRCHERMLATRSYSSHFVGAEDSAIGRETEHLVDAGMAALTAHQRAALSLRAFQRLSYDDIARRLGINVGAARGLVHRARMTLGERLGQAVHGDVDADDGSLGGEPA